MKELSDNNFENAWQQAFEEASLAPPDAIWENIEKTLPNPSAITKPEGGGMATSTKLFLSSGAIIAVFTFLYFYNQTSTQKTNETNNPKTVESIIIEPKIEQPAMAFSPIITSKKQVSNTYIAKKNTSNSLESFDNQAIEPITTEDLQPELPEYSKIEDKFVELKPKSTKLKSSVLIMPDLILNTDSQSVTPYYDPFAIPSQNNEKGKFWKNFKVRGGFRISN